MNKEKLIEKMQSNLRREFYMSYKNALSLEQISLISDMCAEAALKELDNEWVRVEEVPRHKNLLPCYIHHTGGEIREGYVFGYKEIGFKNLAGNEIPARTITHYLYKNLPSPPKDK